jgi:aromatic-L-amino-acid/L-tryptophan decarboxylase
MITRLEADALKTRNAPLAMDSDQFRALGHRLVDQIADRLARVAAGRVVPDESPAEVRELIDAGRGLPAHGEPAETLLRQAVDLLFEHSSFNAHPRFFGYITASPAPIGMLGDFLAAALNQNIGAFRLAPIATEIEAQTVRWIAELVGFPPGGSGVLVSGGNMANFVAFLAARAAKAGGDVRTAGLGGNRPQLLAYASQETHTWLQKATDLFGFGTNAVRWIPVDDRQRIDVDALRRQIADDRALGHQPFFVVGTAGTVSTGAVDPLPELAAICREHDLWFHVDGAYGALAAGVPGAPAALRAIGDADSVAVDPHKWLYAPLEAGCVLVRSPEHLLRAFSYKPTYYHFDDGAVNYNEYGPQNSRGFRALKVWLALRQVGRDGYLKMIGDDIRLAGHLYELASAHPELEAVSLNLSIATFRYVPRDLRSRVGAPEVERYVNDLNQRLLTALEKSGEAFLSNAVVDGKFVLRACVVNFNTTIADIQAVPALVSRLGGQMHG